MHWLWLFTAVLVLTPAPSWSHPGNTAADGCHYCRTNCASWGQVAGARHCHGGVARPPRPAPPPPFQPRRGVERPSAVLHTTGYARIIDGDTVHIGTEKIRLQGIDAPEAQQWCQRANGARYACGHEATAALTQMMAGARSPAALTPTGTSTSGSWEPAF